MAQLRERFVAGALDNGVAQSVAEEAFRQLEGFATYGFCKSHAAAFALVAYQTLWLKAHYPAEFFCALLNHQPMGFYSPEVVVNDARRHGTSVLRPDVNRSEDACTLEQEQGGKSPALRLGLRYLSGLGEAGRPGCWQPGAMGHLWIWPASAAARACRNRWWATWCGRARWTG